MCALFPMIVKVFRAALRGTNPNASKPFRMDVKNSDKNYGLIMEGLIIQKEFTAMKATLTDYPTQHFTK